MKGVNGHSTYHAPCTLETIGYLLVDIAILALLAWYFDHTVSGNRGNGESVGFCLRRKYWKSEMKPAIVNDVKEDNGI